MVVQIGKEKKNLATIEAQKSLNIINIVVVASWCNLIKEIRINLLQHGTNKG